MKYRPRKRLRGFLLNINLTLRCNVWTAVIRSLHEIRRKLNFFKLILCKRKQTESVTKEKIKMPNKIKHTRFTRRSNRALSSLGYCRVQANIVWMTENDSAHKRPGYANS